ncbi:MAG: hypothetical protein PHC75_05740 [Burkholderiales bacterium]|nr:hypothetical protein [Burkholderiales bacterium]
MKQQIQNIKFNFKLLYSNDNNHYGIEAYFNNDIQLYELIDEDGKLITNHTRILNMDNRKIKELQSIYDYNESEIKEIIKQFDTQSTEFLSNTKFLQKSNLIIRYKKRDILHDVELEIINKNKQTGEYIRELISNGYNYKSQNDLAKDTILQRTPYLNMSYEETIYRNDYDPWTITISGKTYFTLFNFIIKRPDRWEFRDGNLYIPLYKFREQVGLYKVTFHLETGIDEDTYFNECNNLDAKEAFEKHLLDKEVISLEKFNFNHPYMINLNNSSKEHICLDLFKFKNLISKQLDQLSYNDKYKKDIHKFNFLAEAYIRGYADKISNGFLDENDLDNFITKNLRLYL